MFSILTHSIGACEQHSLPSKLRAAAQAGFQGVEIFIPDLEHHARQTGKDELAAAKEIGNLCAVLQLQVVCLQPLRDLAELADPAERDAVFERAVSLFPAMDALGTDLVLCCSSFRPAEELVTDPDEIAQQLGRFADAASSAGKRVAFEALSWGTNVWRTMQAWDIVKRADRPNLGMVLDSFNALGREWAEPTSKTGTLSNPAARLATLLSSIHTIPAEKIFFFQVADARLLPSPLAPSPTADEPRPARMIWSRSSRLFPFETDRGAYLPVVEFTRAVVKKCGYQGPLSLEVFNDSLREEGEWVPTEHALRGIIGLLSLSEHLNLPQAKKTIALYNQDFVRASL